MQATEFFMAPDRVRIHRLLLAQALLLMAGWLAILTGQLAHEAAISLKSETVAVVRDRQGVTLVESFGIVIAVVSFAGAGALRARITRLLPRNEESVRIAAEAA